MPSRTKMRNAAIVAKSAALPSTPKELIDLFVTGPMSGDAVNAASVAFKEALIQRAMGTELSHDLVTRQERPSPRTRATTETAAAARPY